jgi:hypothetical protein
MEFWFRKKFNLAPNDPRFLDLTQEQLFIEYWAWQYDANPNLSEEVEDDEFDLDEVVRSMEERPDDWEAVPSKTAES